MTIVLSNSSKFSPAKVLLYTVVAKHVYWHVHVANRNQKLSKASFNYPSISFTLHVLPCNLCQYCSIYHVFFTLSLCQTSDFYLHVFTIASYFMSNNNRYMASMESFEGCWYQNHWIIFLYHLVIFLYHPVGLFDPSTYWDIMQFISHWSHTLKKFTVWYTWYQAVLGNNYLLGSYYPVQCFSKLQ